MAVAAEDMNCYSQTSGISFYDTDYFDVVSGSFRNSYSTITNVTLQVKKSCKIRVYMAKGYTSGWHEFKINNVSYEPTGNYWTNELTLNVGDQVIVKCSDYFGFVFLADADLSIYGGNINV